MSTGAGAPPTQDVPEPIGGLTADALPPASSTHVLRIEDVEARDRMTTGFRLLLAIPWLILQALWGIGALLASVVAWFALVFTGEYPPALYEFVSNYVRYSARVSAFEFLLVDPFPPFDGNEHPDYPAELRLGQQPASYDRVKVLLRFLYVIPAFIVVYVAGIVMEVVGFVSWVVIIITGQQPEGLQNALRWAMSWNVRALLLITLLSESYDLELA
jgi:hypothetical protein